MSVVPCPTNIFPPVCDNPPHPVKTSPAVRVLDCAQSSRCFGQQCRVLQLALAEWLCAHWKTDARAKRIVEGMKLYLLPTMNPDGFAAKQRGNRCFQYTTILLHVLPVFMLFSPELHASGTGQDMATADLDLLRIDL